VPGQSMTPRNRRVKLRFPLDADVRYQVVRRGQGKTTEGLGRVVDISSKGVAFRSDLPLAEGAHLSLSMRWPVLLGERCALRLLIDGSVVRTEGTLIVTSIDSYEFRTSGRVTGVVPEQIASAIRGAEQLFRTGL